MDDGDDGDRARADGGRAPSGVLLVRAWVQDGDVVARVRWSTPGEPEQHMAAVAGTGPLEAWFAGWLRAVMRL